MYTFRVAGVVLACLAASTGNTAPPAATALPTYRFDMGTAESPVADGFLRIDPQTQYDAAKKHGWLSREQTAFDVARPADDPAWHEPAGQMVSETHLIFKEHNDTTRDGVTSRDDLQFRVDLPNGRYRVALTLGRLDRPVCSLQVFLNGQQVATDFDAKHWRSRSRVDVQYGFPRRLCRTVEVTDGVLRVRVHGDDRGFRERFNLEYDKPQPGSYLEGTHVNGVYRVGRSIGLGQFEGGVKPPRGDIARWGADPREGARVYVWEDIGGPFTENSVLGLEIYPQTKRPLEWSNGRLECTSPDAALSRGAELFNGARWGDAERAFGESTDLYGRALGYLWLAGRPQYEEELRLVPQALEWLGQLAPMRKDDPVFQEDFENARRMERAMHRFMHRADEQRSYSELILVTGEVASFQPDDPLYYKSRMYAGRAMYMIIPHRWTYAAGVGRQYFEELEWAGFADNRFVRWFLHDEWSRELPDWGFVDYSKKKQGVPRWAAEVFEAYNRELDLGEWWIRNRQAADGSLGGGWGDDVEILRSLGMFVGVCPDASPLLFDGIRKVADGVWRSGSIDQDAGYFAEVDDTEHSAEWTADTLPLMIRLDFGNPVYVERALKTGKLMRDLWMGYTANGQYIMRSNYLGATGIGGPGTTSDSRINFRSAAPARGVLWYNQLPALQELFLRWADAWWAASMSTDRGKPCGVVPQEIGYPSGQIGGEGSPEWYLAEHPSKTTNYDWEGSDGYLFYLADIFAAAYEMTGNAKYLEPLRLQAEFVQQHLPANVRESTYLSVGRMHPSLWMDLTPGSNPWIATRLGTWPRQWEALNRRLFGGELSTEPQPARLAAVEALAATENDGARRRWPHTTSEAMATDRIHFPGMGSASRTMTGFSDSGTGSLVTYRGLGRNFAAAVLQADAANVQAVLYNFEEQPQDARVIPWVLKQGDEFELTIGRDDNHDALADRIDATHRFRLESTGQEIPFRLGGRQQIVLTIRRLSSGTSTRRLADAALTSDDIRLRSEFGKIDVSVHNIGATAAKQVVVALLDEQDRELGRQTIPHLPAPLGLDPQVVRVAFPYDFSQAGGRRFTAVVDPDNELREITRVNNRATAACPEQLAPRKRHSHP